jgi:DNA-binding beta-propeller fold protein YncE
MKINFKILMILLLCSISALTNAQTYVADQTIALTGDGGYDYLAIDSVNNRLYVSHGTAVNVIDLSTEKSIGTISGMQGVHGIAIVNHLNLGFISDGKANAAVAFDLKTLKVIKTIPLTAVNGPDAIMYDQYSDQVFTFCGDSNNAAVINPKSLKQVGNVALSGAPEFAVSDGKGKIYNNLEDKNSMDVIDAKTMKVLRNFPLNPCGGPTGVARDGKNKRLFTVCRENKGLSVVNEASGKVITTLPIGAGVDAVAYDAATKLIFASNGEGTVTIIKQKTADDYAVIQTLQTQARARTLALDTKTHKIYLSVADMVKGTRNAVPGTFKVLVFKME